MDKKVVVVGAGPVGLCLSLALAARGLDVDVVDRQQADALADPAFDGREIALTHVSMRLLREFGVWPYVPVDEIAPIRKARIMDGDEPGFEVDGAAFGCDRLGVLVSNHLLRKAAWRAVERERRICVHAGVEVEALVTTAAMNVHLSDGRILQAPLLVAADSRFSSCRRAVGIPVRMHDFGKSMLVCRVRHTEPNHAIAWEWFGRAQSRALLPLDAHLSSVVLTVPGAEAEVLMGMTPEAFSAEVAERYEGRLGEVELASTRHAYPLVATWARRFVARRFALAGDTAIGMHPVTAHGFNLGLASVEHLARAAGDGLDRHGDPGHPAILARYQRRHRAGSAPLFAGTQAIVGLFTDDRALAQPMRHAVMRAGRKVPALRRALIASLLDETPRPIPLVHHVGRALTVLRPHVPHHHAFQ